MEFRAMIESNGKTATGIQVPDEIVAELGAGSRPPVLITVGGHTYRTTVARMGARFLVPLSAENRSAAGVRAGDEADIVIELDSSPREVITPDDLAAALATDSRAATTFESLSYTHRKEWVRWIEDSKKPETRADRVTKTVAALREGKRSR